VPLLEVDGLAKTFGAIRAVQGGTVAKCPGLKLSLQATVVPAPAADIAAGRAQVFQSDHIAGRGSGDENDPSIGQPTYAVATGGDAFDAHPLEHAADYWSASSRACRSQAPPIAGSPLVTTWRRVWRSSASASAAAIARS